MSDLQDIPIAPKALNVLHRPYRFGIVFGVFNLIGSVLCAWLAFKGYDPVSLGASGLIDLVTGVGLLRKRRYGFFLLWLSLAWSAAMVVSECFESHLVEHYIAATIAEFVGTAIVLFYFHKRRAEFIGGI